MSFRILILGGYGQFGGRIAATLSRNPGLHLVIAGRSLAAAQAAMLSMQEAGAGATLEALAIDVHGDLASQLQALQPHLVIHTAGPFQGSDYSVARAALAAGAHYVDLADGRDFVPGISTLDTAARHAGRWAISGASSVPALTAAVIEAHLPRFARLDAVHSGISPGNCTARGLATTQAILGYVGQPIRVLHDGVWTVKHGWQSLRRIEFPGIGTRWFARCDVPDLAVLPGRYPSLRSCDFRAGLELRRMHFGLWAAGWLVRWGGLRSMAPFAQALLSVSNHWLDDGSNVGVMHVDLHGQGSNGRPLALRWTMTAAKGDGPQIPATAAIVLARKLAAGTLPGCGARACMDLLTLDDFLDALRPFAIATDLRQLDVQAHR